MGRIELDQVDQDVKIGAEQLVEAQGNLPRFGRLVGHDEIVGEIEQNGDGGLQGVSIRI